MKFGLNDYSKLVFITLSESIKVVGAQQQVSDHDSGIIKVISYFTVYYLF